MRDIVGRLYANIRVGRVGLLVPALRLLDAVEGVPHLLGAAELLLHQLEVGGEDGADLVLSFRGRPVERPELLLQGRELLLERLAGAAAGRCWTR